MAQDHVHERYDGEQRRQFAELAAELPPGEIARIEEAWPPLLAAVRSAREQGLDTASAEAALLVGRWETLTAATMAAYAGRPALVQAIGEQYRQGSFEGFVGAPQAADFAFIAAARAARS